MPFKSKAQARKMAVLEKEGKVKPGTVKEWAAATPSMKKLPERKTMPKSISDLKALAKKIKYVQAPVKRKTGK